MVRLHVLAATAVFAVCSVRPVFGQDLVVDTTGAGVLIDEAFNRSEVMQNLQYLSDVIGPRLTGSSAARRANDWTLERFKAYGLEAHLEPWKFGGTWTRGPMRARMTAPRAHDVIAASWAWAPGTGRTVTGPVVRIDATTPDSFALYRSRVKHAWVMTRPPSLVWNADGPSMTAADSQRQRDFFRTIFTPFRDLDSTTRARMQQFANDLPYLLRRAGALGILQDASKEHALLNMSGSPNRILPLPQIAVAHEDYALFDRLLQAGTTPQLEVSISNTITRDSVPQWNTVAEIRGSEHPGQVVIVGAHLDSWDLGTGTTDNGTGGMCTLEAARIIARSGLQPKRTIRFVLFTGEEQGLIGSRKYAEAHAAEADSIQAVIVLDNGTGAITGQALQGRTDLEGLWRAVLAPVARHRPSRSVRPCSACPVIAPVPLSSTMTAWIESASAACASAYLRDPIKPCSSPVKSTNRMVRFGCNPDRAMMRAASRVHMPPVPLSVVPVPKSQESRCAPTMTT